MKFTPQLEAIEQRISMSVVTALDTLAPGGGHSAPIILEPLPQQPPVVIVAVSVPNLGNLPEQHAIEHA
jgi:hypothetical protein